MRLLAITSCPTGIAHTYMAAEALEEAAKAAGHEIVVETQGAAGSTPFKPEQIDEADALIVAADVAVLGEERFAGIPRVSAGVNRAINDAAGMVRDAVARAGEAPAGAGPETDGAGSRAKGAAGSAGGRARRPAQTRAMKQSESWGGHLRTWLMTGVSYMIPFVAAGGILIALSFLFGGAEVAMKVGGGTFHGHTYPMIADPATLGGLSDPTKILHAAGFPGLMFYMGKVSFNMLVPILAGYIAFAIADRPGLVPGVVAGLLSIDIGAGYLGGLIGGLLAGAIAFGLVKIPTPRWLKGVMPVVVIPLISTLVIGTIMLIAIGSPLAHAQTALTNWLNSLSGTNGMLLGGLLGLMMAFDMGGPVNKVAYTFSLAALASGNYKVMAADMAAGIIPPLALALATVVRPRLFNRTEREAGEAAWLLGASFITEGAIPFAASDPFRVIPSLMLGSAVGGGLSMGLGATSMAPHGGIWVIALIGKPLAYLLAIVVGTVISCAAVLLLKSLRQKQPAPGTDAEPEAADEATPADVAVV